MNRTELLDLTKRFGDVTALSSVSLTVEPGEFISIVGASGCGKTTLLRLVAGFDLPTAGRVLLGEREVSSPTASLPPEQRDIGMVFQRFALWPHMTVADQVAFPLRHRRGLAQDIARDTPGRVDEVLELTGLSQYRDRYPNELSGGQQQRVGLARAIAPRPGLLLMDEPLSALDAELREELRREIQTLHQVTGSSILYVTHDQSEAMSMSDRIAVMREGRLEQLGPPEEVYRKPISPFVAHFVGRANLITGDWGDDNFVPDGSSRLMWQAPDEIAESFRREGLFPLRPEQVSLNAKPGDGLRGQVANALFNGREMHYSVELEQGTVQVYTPANEVHSVGSDVWIEPTESATR